MNYYLEVLKKYAVFSGRATRAEYWYFVLFNIIISFVLGFIAGMLGMVDSNGSSWVTSLYSYAILIPSIAVGVRRMHDVGKSGWYILIPFYNLVLSVRQGTDGANKYGPDPRSEKAAV